MDFDHKRVVRELLPVRAAPGSRRLRGQRGGARAWAERVRNGVEGVLDGVWGFVVLFRWCSRRCSYFATVRRALQGFFGGDLCAGDLRLQERTTAASGRTPA